uniref:Uncharacterized protein LOC114333894 isoform X2 n=1 Tax=Diabrotica virgifera virgifera TaxID=50390 RepID=A0A6P7G3V2_DIAVI
MRPIIFGIVGLLYFIYCTEEGSALNCYRCMAQLGTGSSCESGKDMDPEFNRTCYSPPDSNVTLACLAGVINDTFNRDCESATRCDELISEPGYGVKWCTTCFTDLCNTQTSSVSTIAPTLLSPIIIFTAVLSYF